MEEKLSGIVLGGVAYGENDKILKIFSLEKGMVSARIKGVKQAEITPLTKDEINIITKSNFPP